MQMKATLPPNRQPVMVQSQRVALHLHLPIQVVQNLQAAKVKAENFMIVSGFVFGCSLCLVDFVTGSNRQLMGGTHG